jgi:hypothetical protein
MQDGAYSLADFGQLYARAKAACEQALAFRSERSVWKA